MRRVVWISVLVALVSTAMYAGACGGGDDGASSGGPSETSLDDVIYEGNAVDEALIALLSATPKADASQAAVFDAPAAGAALPGGAAPELSWQLGGAAQGRAPSPGAPARRAQGRWGALGELVGPIRAARAHGEPINGRAYFLVFSTARREGVLRVFTSRLTYTPDAAAWEKLRSAGETITVTVLNAVFENNRVAPGGGPFEGEPLSFSIQP
jgi:hypothetical protein